MTKLKKISANLNDMPTDVRAEVLLAQAMDGGLRKKEFLAQADSFFYRTYVHDLYKVNVDDQDVYASFLKLHLSRQGLYDILPEGIFFQRNGDNKKLKSAIEMAEEYRINKKKEVETRKFFAAFEDEFFYQTILNEIEENNLLQGLQSGWLKEYFVDFWKLPQDIPSQAALILVMFLPFVHTITGDTNITANALQKILNEPVNIKLVYKFDTVANNDHNILGENDLGNQFVCGENIKEQYPLLLINIGPLEKTYASDYIENGQYYSLLNTFYNFFIPANAEISTNIILKSTAEKLILNTNEAAPLLGISSVL